MSLIHSTAIIDPKAEIADGVEIGPYAVVGPHVKIGKNS
jgi:UDP-N-acetylglucosamine acyltransferase